MALIQQIDENELRALTNLVLLRSEQLSAELVILVNGAASVKEQLVCRHQCRLSGSGAANHGTFD